MSEEKPAEEEMEPFTMITKEDVAGASAGFLGTFSSGKTWIQVRGGGERVGREREREKERERVGRER